MTYWSRVASFLSSRPIFAALAGVVVVLVGEFTLAVACLTTGRNLSVRSALVARRKYCVAASSPPVRMPRASSKLMFFTALTGIGLASTTASSAAWVHRLDQFVGVFAGAERTHHLLGLADRIRQRNPDAGIAHEAIRLAQLIDGDLGATRQRFEAGGGFAAGDVRCLRAQARAGKNEGNKGTCAWVGSAENDSGEPTAYATAGRPARRPRFHDQGATPALCACWSAQYEERTIGPAGGAGEAHRLGFGLVILKVSGCT